MEDIDLDVKNHVQKTKDTVFYLRFDNENKVSVCISKDSQKAAHMIHEAMHEDKVIKKIIFNAVIGFLVCSGGVKSFIALLKQIKKIKI